MSDKLTVDRSALIQVLNALNGHGHEIRELQATRSLHAMGGEYTNPIETLLAEVRVQLTPQMEPAPVEWTDQQLGELCDFARTYAQEVDAESRKKLIEHLATLGAKP